MRFSFGAISVAFMPASNICPQLIIIGLGPLPPARARSAHILLASGLEKHDPDVSAGELNSVRTVQAMSTVIAHHPIQNLSPRSR